jgi:putative ABC transport system permease protein
MPERATRGRRSLFSLLRRTSVEEEVGEELEFHLEMTARALVERGMTPDKAHAEALRRFGDRTAVDEQCRRFGHQRDQQRSRAEYLGALTQDARFALRQLGRARTFAATAVLTLAVGIGATAAVFSVLHAVVLRPLPFDSPERVVRILPGSRRGSNGMASGAEFAAMRELRQPFSQVAAYVSGAGFTITDGDVPELVGGAFVTADYFRVFGVPPALGRGFLSSDDVPGAPLVVVLSHRLWQRKYHADPTILGGRLRLNGQGYAVVGVMPASFDVTSNGDELWAPLALTPQALANNDGSFLRIVARMRPGVTLQQSSALTQRAESELAARSPGTPADLGAAVHRYADELVGDYRGRLFILLGAVGFVLVIACVNVANLLLARATSRARELAIRAALGAGRARLVRQLLAESLVLSAIGAVIGVLLALLLVRGLVAVAPSGVPRLEQARVDGAVLAFTLGVALASSLLIGLMPALRAAGPALQTTLREGGRSSSGAGGGRRDRVRALLVGAEVALAMALLTGSGLLIRTAWLMQHVDPGFVPRHVLTARLLLPAARYSDPNKIVQAYDRVQEAAAQVPGVSTAALVSVIPMSGSSMSAGVAPEGRATPAADRVTVDVRLVSPGYFEAMGIRLRDGRDVLHSDDASAPSVAVISQSLANKLWPGERVVGRRIDALSFTRGAPHWLEIVGVVNDLHDVGLAAPVRPAIYIPTAQTPAPLWPAIQRSLVLVARTMPEPRTVLQSLRRAVMSVDPSLPLADEHTMDELLADSLATARFNTIVLSALGLAALLLASVGVYGVVSYYVNQRTQEIGLRLALGATPSNIWRLVLRKGLTPIAGGAVMGALLSLATARLLRGELFGVGTDDPATLVVVTTLLLLVSVLATYVPARRAMRVPPAVALG